MDISSVLYISLKRQEPTRLSKSQSPSLLCADINKNLAAKHLHPSTKQPEIVWNVFRIYFQVFDRDALRKIILPRWGVGAVGAGSGPGGAVGGARFDVLRLGEGRVPSAECPFA
jgi:hypothetical protein